MRRLIVVLLAAVGAAGCGEQRATISGTATYDNRPIDKGSVTFRAANSSGKATVADIVDGRYRVDGVPAGEKVVDVVSVKKFEVAEHSGQPGKDLGGFVIPPGAVGNGQKFTVVAGVHELNLDIKPPAKK